MGLFDREKRRGGFMDEIRCDEPSYLIWKWHPAGVQLGEGNRENAIRWGSSLRVKDGEVAVFVYSQYYAYNAEGYKLSLYYTESDSKMHIGVDAAEQYGTLVWSDSAIASMLPVPTSTTGEITQDDEKGFQAYVSNTPMDEFKAYAAACADKGFNIDVEDYGESYSAENSEGYKLSVLYHGNGVISISVDEPEYEVSVEIECVENLIFSKYDVDVYIDDNLEGTVTHGTTETFTVTLTKGTYEIKFVSAEDDEATGTVNIDIHQDELLKYKISCTSTQINIETIAGTIPEHGEDEAPMPQSASDYKYDNYADVQQELADAGFTNISFEILYDIELGWTEEGEVDSVSVDGKAEFEQGDIFKKDASIVITYHMPVEDDPNDLAATESAETEVTETEMPDAESATPASEYELAFVRRLSSYSLYIMFDTDTKTAAQFGTDDTYLYKGPYTGDFSSGVTIAWDHGEFTEKFVYQDGSSIGTYIDGNGYEWEYSKCDPGVAQEVLDTRE